MEINSFKNITNTKLQEIKNVIENFKTLISVKKSMLCIIYSSKTHKVIL